MSVTSHYGPEDRNPDFYRGEWQYADLSGNGTEVMVSAGMGLLGNVEVGVAASSQTAKFYDTPSGGTTDATTLIATVDLGTTGYRQGIHVAFSNGLTCIISGGSGEITVEFMGRASVSTNWRRAGHN